jgi:hypothetical protein
VIVDAAERAALGVIDDAEKEARRYLDEAQARADLIVAEHLREAADLLERSHGASAPSPVLRPVEDDRPAAPQQPAGSPTAGERPVGPGAWPEPQELPEDAAMASGPPRHTGSAAARLLATQMAVSGASRQEIEMRLRNGFEIEDTNEILDAILGPEE